MSTGNSIPLYEQIQNDLMEQIQSGKYAPGDRVPSEKEIAAQYGVSRITAVKALTELSLTGYISRVQGKGSFANPLGQHLRPSARILPAVSSPKGQPRRIGLLIPEHCDHHSGSIIRSVTHALNYPDYFVNVILTHQPGLEEHALENFIDSGYDGVLLFPIDCEFYSDAILRMHLNKSPFVLIDRVFPGIHTNSVTCDNEAGSALAVEHLISLGHRRIAFVAAASFEEQITGMRHGGYVSAMNAARLPSFSLERFDHPETDARETLKILRQNGITAVLASNSNTAIHLYEQCLANGIRVPEDLSIVCFDQPEVWHHGHESYFTHIEQRSEEMGRTAAQILIDAIENGGEADKQVCLKPRLISGRSTIALKQ